MGYIIEVSFNIFKNSNITEIEAKIISFAKNCNSTFFYSNYEMEKNIRIQRNHMIITAHFEEEKEKIQDLLCFLNYIKKQKGIYIESIYNEETNQILYASQYYLTMMDKFLSKKYQTNKRSRSYSEDETIILNEIDKNPQKILVKN